MMKKQIYNKYNKLKISSLPRAVFNGRIHVVISRAQAEKAVNFLLKQPILGLTQRRVLPFRKARFTTLRCFRYPLMTLVSSLG